MLISTLLLHKKLAKSILKDDNANSSTVVLPPKLPSKNMRSAEDKSGYVKVCDFFEIVLQIVKVDLYVRIYIIHTCSNGGTYSELGAI